jgi:hypothetical protein
MKDSHVIRREASGRAARRLALSLLLAATLSLSLASVASASTASVVGTTLTYTAAAGEANIVSIGVSGADYAISDAGATVTAGDGCVVTENVATCPAAAVTGISVDAADMNDQITVDGTVTVHSFLNGRGGNDTITSRNGVQDSVFCGGGFDSAILDELDAWEGVPCEQVDNGVDPGPIEITEAPPTPTNSTSASFNFTSPDPQAQFECSVDSAEFAGCSPLASYGPLGEGTHTFTVQATDEGGRTAAPVGHSWVIDLTGPAVTITAGPTGTISTRTATFRFSSPESGLAFQCSIDSSDWIACTSPITYSGLPEGAHTFAVRAHDEVMNFTTATRTFIVDVPPEGVPVTPANAPSSLVLISGRTVKVSKRGFASIALNCSGTKNCAGRLILATSKRVRYSRKRKRKRIVRLASKKFVIPAGRTKQVKVHISRRKVRLVRRLRRVKTDVIVRDRDRAGRARVSTRTVVLRAPR